MPASPASYHGASYDPSYAMESVDFFKENFGGAAIGDAVMLLFST